jgi:hypothetical protein
MPGRGMARRLKSRGKAHRAKCKKPLHDMTFSAANESF